MSGEGRGEHQNFKTFSFTVDFTSREQQDEQQDKLGYMGSRSIQFAYRKKFDF